MLFPFPKIYFFCHIFCHVKLSTRHFCLLNAGVSIVRHVSDDSLMSGCHSYSHLTGTNRQRGNKVAQADRHAKGNRCIWKLWTSVLAGQTVPMSCNPDAPSSDLLHPSFVCSTITHHWPSKTEPLQNRLILNLGYCFLIILSLPLASCVITVWLRQLCHLRAWKSPPFNITWLTDYAGAAWG